MKRILYNASEVFEVTQNFFGKTKAIAENEDTGVEVYAASNGYNNDSEQFCVFISVFENGNKVASAVVSDESSCTEIVQKYYDEYLKDYIFDADDDEEFQELINSPNEFDADNADEIAIIEENESLIDIALDGFIEQVVGFSNVTDAEFHRIKDRFCEVLASEFNLDIIRPMLLSDENGEVFFTENPYLYLI